MRRWLGPSTLLVGSGICVVTLIGMIERNVVEIRLQPTHLAIASLCALASLATSAFAWRKFLQAWVVRPIGYREALAQVGLVLIGKYVPGKISGIAARIAANQPAIGARTVIAATVIEQMGAMGAAIAVGASAWLFLEWPAIAWVPLVASACWPLMAPRLLRALARRWPRLRSDGHHVPDAAALRSACAWQMLQWVALTLLACTLTDMLDLAHGADILLHIAGAYGLAVVAGQLSIIFPGGIGPREGVFVWLLSGVLAAPQALTIALALRVATTGIDLLGALGYFARGLRSPPDKAPRSCP